MIGHYLVILKESFQLSTRSPYDKIRLMDSTELKEFVSKNRKPAYRAIEQRSYTKNDRILASQVTYARNLLRMQP